MEELKAMMAVGGIKFVYEEDLPSSTDDDSIELQLTASNDSSASRGSMSTKAIFSKWVTQPYRLEEIDSVTSSNDTLSTFQEEDDYLKVEAEQDTSSSADSDSTFFEPDPNEFISSLEAIGIISVLEDTVDQLHILGLASPESSVQPEIVYRSLEEKFRQELAKATIIDSDTDKPIAQSAGTSVLIKLQRDRAFVEKALSQALDELKMNGTYTSLLSVVASEAYSLEEEEALLREEKKNSATMRRLKQELQENTEGTSKLMVARDEMLADLKDQFQDKFFGGKMKVKFVDKWEKARQQQNSLKHSIDEGVLKTDLDQTNFNVDVEQRVHTEIEDYIRQSQTKLEEEIESWMERYDQEIEQRDVDLNYLKQERATHYKEFEDLALLYQHHKNEIEEYLVKKEIRETKRLHELMLYTMATRIQAWWRGIMVRHHLGPYRKKKGKGKGKDKKGKDKGKKKK